MSNLTNDIPNGSWFSHLKHFPIWSFIFPFIIDFYNKDDVKWDLYDRIEYRCKKCGYLYYTEWKGGKL